MTELSTHVEVSAVDDDDLPPFRTLEETHQLAIETTHRMIAKLATIPDPNEAAIRVLKLLTSIVVEAQRLEIEKFLVMHRLGVREQQR